MGNCFQKPVNNLSSPNNTPTSANINSDDKKKEPVIGNRPAMAAEGGGGGENGGTIADSGETEPLSGRDIVTPNLKMFTFVELKSATRNFRPDGILGEGGFGRVFKGWVAGETYAPSNAGVGITVAVKRFNYKNDAHLKEWQVRMSFLEKFNHPNLVKLLGYCSKDGEFFLVREYMEKGSLEKHLFRSTKPLQWNTRIKIATEVAQGLAFLHRAGKTIIYKNFKSSNILLDKDFNAKLLDFGLVNLDPANDESYASVGMFGNYDFGLANLGPANGHYSTSVDTYDYAAPEYIATDDSSVKNDVYSFGVVLLEMITGLRVLDTNRPISQHNLVEWARPLLSDKKRLQKIIDPRLENDYPSEGASKASNLILSCLKVDPKNRPSMGKVLASLQQISTIKTKTKESKVKTSDK